MQNYAQNLLMCAVLFFAVSLQSLCIPPLCCQLDVLTAPAIQHSISHNREGAAPFAQKRLQDPCHIYEVGCKTRYALVDIKRYNADIFHDASPPAGCIAGIINQAHTAI